MNNLTATVDTELLQKKANEYAQKGAEETIKDFYSGYNSPYKKAIEEDLKNKGLGVHFELPSVIAKINEAITAEIDAIANTAIAKTFVPLVTRFLTRAEKEINLSDILKEFINYCDFDPEKDDLDDYELTIEDDYENEPNSCLFDNWYTVTISNNTKSFGLRFYKKDKVNVTFIMMSLPSDFKRKGIQETMKLSLNDGVTLEMPFTSDVLHDGFMSYLARLVMAESKITIDVKEFNEDLFPERENCHC